MGFLGEFGAEAAAVDDLVGDAGEASAFEDVSVWMIGEYESDFGLEGVVLDGIEDCLHVGA